MIIMPHSWPSHRCSSQARQTSGTPQVRHSSRSITETVYRHEIRPALTKGATAMNRILNAKVANWLSPAPGNPLAPPLAPETYIKKCL
jgi:hypothetical protein